MYLAIGKALVRGIEVGLCSASRRKNDKNSFHR